MAIKPNDKPCDVFSLSIERDGVATVTISEAFVSLLNHDVVRRLEHAAMEVAQALMRRVTRGDPAADDVLEEARKGSCSKIRMWLLDQNEGHALPDPVEKGTPEREIAGAVEPKFKVGDRVRVLGSVSLEQFRHAVGVVESGEMGGRYGIRLDDPFHLYLMSWQASELEKEIV